MTKLKIFLMATLMIFAASLCGNSEAAIVRDKLPLQCYVADKVITYDLNTRRQVGYISPQNDLIQITAIGSDGIARGTYPGQGGRRVERLFRASDIFADTNYSNRSVHVSGSHQVYRTRNSNATIGSIANEDVTVVADNGSRAQIVYRLNNGTGYKMGWVPSSIVATRGNLTVSPQNPMVERVTRPIVNYAQPEQGDYYIIPLNSSCAIDVPNNSHSEGTVLQIYGQNNMPAQIFRLERVANGWYKIIHKDSGYVLNCQWGSNGNGTRLWLYHYDGTASCHWRFRDLGGGVYNIESELSSNPFLEVQNGNPFNGAVLQLWQQHTGNAAKWTLKKANENWSSKVGQKLANENSENYTKPINPFPKSYTSQKDGSYHKTNCTWYAWGRMREVTGKSISFSQGNTNGGQWHNRTKWDTNLTSKCVAEREGHVVFVEYVDNNNAKVYYTECNWNVRDDYKVQVMDISTFKSKFKWFIH